MPSPPILSPHSTCSTCTTSTPPTLRGILTESRWGNDGDLHLLGELLPLVSAALFLATLVVRVTLQSPRAPLVAPPGMTVESRIQVSLFTCRVSLFTCRVSLLDVLSRVRGVVVRGVVVRGVVVRGVVVRVHREP